jgi:D-alanyl-lipoteichoic acid acyltransferase DltB (MBOAT superfamily)
MLFNSYEFILVFLPVTLAGFFMLGLRSRNLALAWIVTASLAFYAWWRPINVLIIAPSILVNFALARWLLRLTADKHRAGLARLALLLGIVFNVAFLGYFKYVNFLATTANDLLGTNFVLTQVVLPLGISFITFQKIAFLIDVHGRRIPSFSLRDYCLFVLFFPQLIAGPIVHYREMMPQFQQAQCRWDKENIAVGLSLFVFGLFKKVVLADGISEYVSPIYQLAGAGSEITFIPAWIAAVGFTLQIYFDFSGYSDMALGLARFFGVRLPANFDSPLKATNIIDFWLRWHMTLTRFLTAYLYNPLALWLTRRRMARGKPGLGSRAPSLGAFFQVLAAPTLLTMFASGLWHGAGYLFILWGLLHGVYLSVNHAWRLFGPRIWVNKETYDRIMRPTGFVLTFLSVAVAMVLFRSANASAAKELLEGVVGLNGISLPQQILAQLGPLTGVVQSFVSASTNLSAQEFMSATAWLGVLLLIALLLPNTLQLMAHYEPALGVRSTPTAPPSLLRTLDWAPTVPWALAMSSLAVAAAMRLGGKSEFLYWQF